MERNVREKWSFYGVREMVRISDKITRIALLSSIRAGKCEQRIKYKDQNRKE